MAKSRQPNVVEEEILEIPSWIGRRQAGMKVVGSREAP